MEKNIDTVKYYWDKNPCRGKWNEFEKELEYVRRKEDWVLKLIERLDVKNKKVLDVGCGTGLYTFYIYKKMGDITGIDISNKSVLIANNRFKKIGIRKKCFIGNAESMRFRDNSFDIAVSIGVLHHTPNIGKAVKEIHRVLKPEGKIGIMLYRKFSFQFLIIRALRFLNYKNWIYKAIKPNKNRRYRTFFTEMLTCPIVNIYSAREAMDIFKGFTNFKFESVHTGMTRIIDFTNVPKSVEKFFYDLNLALKGLFGCYLTFYAEKEK